MEKEEFKTWLHRVIKDTIEATLVELVIYVLISLTGVWENIPYTDKIRALFCCIIGNFILLILSRIQIERIKDEYGLERCRIVAEFVLMIIAFGFLFVLAISYYLYPELFFISICRMIW
jgi:amino acid permease